MTKWHISSAIHTSFLSQQKKKKANVSDPSEVSGNITVIFKRIKTDPQILFSILMSNLIAIMRIKSLGSHLRWLQPQNTNEKKLQFKFSYYSFKKKIHCCLVRQSYTADSWLTVPAVNCYGGEQQPLPHVVPRRHQWVSGRLELLSDTQIILCYFSFQLLAANWIQLIHTKAHWNIFSGKVG